MSERMELLERPPEHELIEAHSTPDRPKQAERLDSLRNETHEDNPSDRINEIRSSIQESATSSSETIQAVAAPANHNNQLPYHDKKSRAQELDKELNTIRKQLPKSEQVLSRVVHTKSIQTVSNAAEKTVARPQALLWGGLFAVISSAALYMTAKYIGFEYNYLVSILCFVGGYAVGLIVELALRILHPATHA
jgi:hypothetical protein